ncbi:hypothetical protein B0T18DRAFT_420489 [Schizothecium vesticola]|uniref:Uncharacterized protein n=1 Tax=Schizothecium vesticola TaxID=314040 RepID=A0AA40BP02_9PEZI|nr:hypothetical protein B0T18DRAFT_420489 [Schizothecium vesticola]
MLFKGLKVVVTFLPTGKTHRSTHQSKPALRAPPYHTSHPATMPQKARWLADDYRTSFHQASSPRTPADWTSPARGAGDGVAFLTAAHLLWPPRPSGAGARAGAGVAFHTVFALRAACALLAGAHLAALAWRTAASASAWMAASSASAFALAATLTSFWLIAFLKGMLSKRTGKLASWQYL